MHLSFLPPALLIIHQPGSESVGFVCPTLPKPASAGCLPLLSPPEQMGLPVCSSLPRLERSADSSLRQAAACSELMAICGFTQWFVRFLFRSSDLSKAFSFASLECLSSICRRPSPGFSCTSIFANRSKVMMLLLILLILNYD